MLLKLLTLLYYIFFIRPVQFSSVLRPYLTFVMSLILDFVSFVIVLVSIARFKNIYSLLPKMCTRSFWIRNPCQHLSTVNTRLWVSVRKPVTEQSGNSSCWRIFSRLLSSLSGSTHKSHWLLCVWCEQLDALLPFHFISFSYLASLSSCQFLMVYFLKNVDHQKNKVMGSLFFTSSCQILVGMHQYHSSIVKIVYILFYVIFYRCSLYKHFSACFWSFSVIRVALS